MRKLLFSLVASLILSIIITGCSTLFLSETPEFIKVKGTQFWLDDKPYYFLGTN